MAIRVIASEGRWMRGVGNFVCGDVITTLSPEREAELIEQQPWAFEKVEEKKPTPKAKGKK